MLAWIALLLLVVAEAIAIKWWSSAQLRPVFFNDWAAFLYSLILLVDIIAAWLISMLYVDGGSPTLQLMVVLGIMLSIVVGLGTFFIRWVVRLDMTDISKKDKQ
jgi:hypothetical protein